MLKHLRSLPLAPSSGFSNSSGLLQRRFSSARKTLRHKQRTAQFAERNKAMYDESSLPVFADLMRKIYMRSHPDLLRASAPEKAAVNDSSMQSLNSVLTIVKRNKEFPTAADKAIPFHVKIDDEVQLVELKLKTGGGDCRHQLAACFQDFFEKTKIHSGKFTWGKDYFPESGEDVEEKESPCMLALEPAVDNDGRLLMSQITFETGSNTYLLQVWVGDDVVERTDATCAELKLDDDDCFEILLQLVDQIRQRYELAIPVYVFVDGVETKVAIAIGFELRSELHNICSYTPPEERPRCMYRTLRTLWVVLGTRIAAGYHGLRLMNLTYEHLDSEGVIFAVPAAQIPPKGIGNVLKGYITALSVHRNSKIIAGTSILTNYDDVLVPHHIMSDEDKYRAQSIENFETWRWLVLAEETRHFPVQSKFRDGSRFGGILMNPRLINLFDRTVRIDLRFDSESVPSIVKERIFRGIDRLQFQGHILDQSNDVLSGITRPLLAVSVRSWSAVHEQSEGRRYDHQAYRECIKNAVLNYSIKSVLVAVDNPEMLLDEYVMYIQSLGVELSVHTVEYAAVDPLVKGVVELLALSQADIIIGDQLSTFVELAFWMGKGRAVFLRPYKEEIF